MNLFFKTLTIFLVLLGALFFVVTTSKANDDICPKDKTLEQCYEELNKRIKELERQEKQATENLSAERYNQLTLNQRIDYIKRKIQESEAEIRRMEIELETKNVEIKMMERDIEKTQDKIVSVQQEAQNLKASVTKRLALSYKYSFMNPLELLVQAQDLDHFLRKMRYLIDTRRSDKELLAKMNSKSIVLDAEEKVLGRSKLDLEKARIEVEGKKTDLFEEKQNLARQQSEQSNLLQVSKQREASYEQELSYLEKAQNDVTQQISAIIKQMYERGEIALNRPVSKGDLIGFQGHTGLSYGSHIHFEVNFGHMDPFAAGYFSGSPFRGSLLSNRLGHIPVHSAIVTQGFHSGGFGGNRALDLRSNQEGDQTGNAYFKSYNSIRCTFGTYPPPSFSYLPYCNSTGCWFGLRGEGAPVYAIADGYASAIQIDVCGGKYVILEHYDGNSSLYLHLQ